MGKSVLIVDSVQKSFDNKLVLSDIYLKSTTGEIIGLLGRNGSGKSTLLKIIFGVLPADYKFVQIDGIKKDRAVDLLADISYLSQDNFIPPHLKVSDVIAMSIEKNRIQEFLSDGYLSNLLSTKVGQLSGGELRFLEIKLILFNPSKFALLDEPYNGLSPIMIDQVNALIVKSAANKGIIITDHNYLNVLKVSDRIIVMHGGRTRPIIDNQELVKLGYLAPSSEAKSEL